MSETATAAKHDASREDLKGTAYGDQYPVSIGGRIVGTLMLTIGVALFATFSGFLANAFLSRKPEQPPAADGTAQAALQEIERLLAEQQRATEALRARLLEL